ncbi:MAG: diacylglycerol kinase family protein [Bacteroidota bacterium]
MSQYTVILNPIAGKGGGRKLIDPIRKEFEKRGVDYELVVTTGPGHATQAARDSGAPVVVAVGGDGTLNEVANGIAGSLKALGIIPAGSGNDFIKSVNIPANVRAALEILFAGRIREVDAGEVSCGGGKAGPGNSPARLFVNGVGIGFDAAVAARTRQIRYLSGTTLYVTAVLQTLGRYEPPDFALSMDHTTEHSRNLLIAVGNGKCAGGGFYLTPDAEVDDGLLDICVVGEKTIPEILTLMPKVMRGKHHNVPGVKFFRERHLSVSSDASFFVHADGEIVGENVSTVTLGIRPRCLKILAPPKA